MSILTLSSCASVRKGYEYYKQGKIISVQKCNNAEYSGQISGSGTALYDVSINIDHPRQSQCTCPHSHGRRIMCKHIVALYFHACPEDAEIYKEAIEQYEAEIALHEETQDRLYREHCDSVRKYVNSLTKAELQDKLYDLLINQYEENCYDDEDDDYYW